MIRFLPKSKLSSFLKNLGDEGELIGPVVEGGHHYLVPVRDPSEVSLDYVNFAGPVKEWLFPREERLYSFRKNPDRTVELTSAVPDDRRRVLFGVRPCDVAGIEHLDRYFMDGHDDPFYRARRENTLIVAVACTTPGPNCFCASVGAGPKAASGYDLQLTDIGRGFLVESGSPSGDRILEGDLFEEASPSDLDLARDAWFEAARRMPKSIDLSATRRALEESYEDPIWAKLAAKCLRCGGCNFACPTCACFDIVEVPLDENSGARDRVWDSCQFEGFSRLAGNHNPRDKVARFRYRFYDKLKFITDKFDTKGCVGCGRCLDACLVNIDIVEVARRLTEVTEG